VNEERVSINEEKTLHQTKYDELVQGQIEVKLPPPVKNENKLNVFLIGPDQCGKTTAANYMAQEHQRCVIRLDQIVDFWQKRNHPLYEEAKEYLDAKAEEMEKRKEEESKKKPKKGKLKPGEVPEPEFVEAEYGYLPKDLLKRMINKRLEEEDCNAGAIYDCLTSTYWEDEKVAIELICESQPE
jgi:adenylate kinase family enzyme